ncbi:MAG TPA: sigma-70 family RNA polymerase sigma factor, partial [Candidatus Sulfotelmatobacter sp.]|nr:sigma-70 family RNA polymerase sigma factor [Candidatus Sulfotelmatobacter sp.]
MLATQEQQREVTQLLLAWNDGDESALEKLAPLVYAELRRLAKRRMRLERPDHTLQTTALINEAYLRLVDVRNVHWQNRAHFFALCARLMRRILVDYARTRHYAKRGGGAQPVSLEQSPAVSPAPSTDLVAVDDALKALTKIDDRKAQVVELRFFGGLTVEESAEVLKVSPETVRRDWKLA